MSSRCSRDVLVTAWPFTSCTCIIRAQSPASVLMTQLSGRVPTLWFTVFLVAVIRAKLFSDNKASKDFTSCSYCPIFTTLGGPLAPEARGPKLTLWLSSKTPPQPRTLQLSSDVWCLSVEGLRGRGEVSSERRTQTTLNILEEGDGSKHTQGGTRTR